MPNPWEKYQAPDTASGTAPVQAPAAEAGPWTKFASNEPAPAPAPKLQPPDKSRSIARAAGDLGIGLGEGTVSAGMFIPQLANTLTGGAVDKYAFKPLTSAIDAALGGPGEGNTLAQASQQTRGALDQFKSPQLRQQEQELADTKGFLPTVKKIVTSPTTLLPQYVAEQAAQLVAPGGLVKKAGAVAFERAAGSALARGIEKRVAAGMSEEAATKAAQGAAERLGKRAAIKAGTKAAIGTEALQSGSQNSEQAQQEVMGLDQSVLDADPAYKALVASGVSPQDAREQRAQSAGLRAGAASAAITAATGGLTGKLESKIFQGETGVEGLGKLFTRQGAKEFGKAFGKETVQEGLQEGGEQFGQNVGVHSVDPNKGLFDQVPESAGAGSVLGGFIGGGMFAGSAALTHPRAEREASGPLGRAAEVVADSRAAAAPGSLTDVAQSIGGLRPNETGAESAGVPRVPGAGDATPPAPSANANEQPQAPAPAPAPAPRMEPQTPPWVNQQTGAISTPTKAELTTTLASHIADQYNQLGHMRVNTGDLADAWGVPVKDINKARNAATQIATRIVKGQAENGVAPSGTPSPEADTGTTASVPFMITQAMRTELRGLGHTDADIRTMTPEQAHDTLKAAEPVLGKSRDLMPHDQPAADEAVKQAQADATTSADAALTETQPAPAAKDANAEPTPVAEPAKPADQAPPESARQEAANPVPESQGRPTEGVVAQAPEEAAGAQGEAAGGEASAQPVTKVTTGGGVSGAGGGQVGSGATAISAPTNPVHAALRKIAAREHPADVLGSADEATVRAVGKALGRPFSAKAPRSTMVKRIGETPAAARWKKAAAVVAKLDAQATTAAVAESTPHKVTGATRQAEAFRVKTADGETNGRSHVDNLIKAGYTKVESTQAGDKMVHSLVNADGEHQSIKARQLPYAKEVAERHAAQAAEIAAHAAAPSPHNTLPAPTPAQMDAGNFKMGHLKVHGLDVSIEQPQGSTRKGVSADGKPWSHVMSHHYGYVRGTVGADSEHVDAYVGPHHDSTRAFVVDQVDQKTGAFDEHKIMLGFKTQTEAIKAYKSNFDKGWKVGRVTGMSTDAFKTWLKEGDTTKPLKPVKAKGTGVKDNVAAEPVATDRRTQQDQRAAIDALPPEQSETEKLRARVADLERERSTSDVTGLRNKRAFDDDAALGWKAVGAADMDGLKLLNDSIGHEAADSVLKLLGDHLRSLESDAVRFYHRSGDEFAARFKNAEDAEPTLRAAQDALDKVQVEFTFDGKPLVYDGIGLSVGHGETYEQADTGVTADKAARLASGKRQHPRESGAPGRLRDATAQGQGEQRGTERRPAVSEAGKGEVGNPPDTPDSSKAQPASKPIDDFGETLHGARKHYAQAYADQIKSAEQLDLASHPLSKTWPAPDYQKWLEAGADPKVAAFVHAARDEVPTKPSKGWKLRGWVEQTKLLRDMSNQLLGGDVIPEVLQAKLAEPHFKLVRDRVGGRAELYEAVGHDIPLKGVSLSHHHYTLYRGEKNVSKWAVERKGKGSEFGNWPAELGVGKTKQEAIDAFQQKASDLKPDAAKKKPKPAPLVIYSRRAKKEFYIGLKVRGGAIDLKQFGAVAEARAYLTDHHNELLDAVAKLKDVPYERASTNDPRVGVDYRNGADVTPEQFNDSFGFRGVQFGNYVEGPRRQQDLNNAYDAMMDLAAVLGVPPKSLSLDGTLGLAFGARGKGGKRAPMAHYESGNVVINLTKGSGAGSLAHEWWHGLDNYFAKMRAGSNTGGEGFATEVALNRVGHVVVAGGVREEMMRAFTRVANTLHTIGMRERSKNLDKLRTKDYWSTGREMSARAFEHYVIAKLEDQSGANDYLANVVSEKAFGRDEEYPYPTVAEIPEVRGAFDDFFNTIEHEETPQGNVRLFSMDSAGDPVGGREATSFNEAREAAKDFIGKPIKNENGLVPATVSNKTLAKMLSKSAVEKSTSLADHVRAVANVDALYRVGVLDGSYSDKRGEPTIAGIHRVVAPMIGPSGEVLAVKMTVKETTGANSPNPLYTVETLDVEKPALLAPQSGIEPTPGQNRNVGQAGFSPDVTRMLEQFKQRLFRHGSDESSSAVVEQGSKESVGHAAKVQAAVDDLTSSWKGDDLPKVEVVATPEDLPNTAKFDPNTGKPDIRYKTASGFYDGKTIWIVASKHEDTATGRAKIVSTLTHEAVGHYGIERIVTRELGDKAWSKIEQSIERLRNDTSLGSKAMRSVLDSVERRYRASDGTPADRKTYAREVLAVMAERGVRNGILDRAMTALRRFVRKLFPKHFEAMHLNERELRQLLVKSDEYLQHGQTYAQRVQSRAAMAFSKNEKTSEADAYRDNLAKAMKSSGDLDKALPIGRASEALKAAGLADLPLVIKKDTVLKATRGERQPEMQGKGNVHDVRMADIQNLPELLDRPVMVLRSRTQPNSVVAITDARDLSGRPVVVALHADVRSGVTEVHRVASVYGKDGVAGFVRDDLKGGRLLYRDSQKSPAWLKSVGLQLPGDRAVRDSWDSVPTQSADVKPETTPGPSLFSRDENDRGEKDEPGKPRAPFSDAAASMETMDAARGDEQRTAWQQAKDWIAGKVQDMKPGALGWLHLRHIVELAQSVPAIAKGATQYRDTEQAMEGYRQRLENEGGATVKKVQQWAFEHGPAGWMGSIKPEAHRMFQFMARVTQLQVDPTAQYEKLLMSTGGGEMLPWTKDLIKARIKVLREVMLGRSGDDKKAMMDQIKDLQGLPKREKVRETQHPNLVREWNTFSPEAQEAFASMRDYYTDYSEKMLEAHIGMVNASTTLPEGNKRAQITQMRDAFAQSQVGGVYFPLGRFGDFWISGHTQDVMNESGEVTVAGKYFHERYENAAAQERAERRIKAAGGTVEASGRADGNYQASKAPKGTFVSEIIGVLKASGASDKALDEVYQTYLKTMPELAMSKHGIHRKNVAGYTDDVVRVFAHNVQHGSIQLARATYGYQLNNALEHIEGALDAMRYGGNTPATHKEFRAFMEAVISRTKRNREGELALAERDAAAGKPGNISAEEIQKFVNHRMAAAMRDAGAEKKSRREILGKWEALPDEVREHYADQVKTLFGGNATPAEGNSVREVAHAEALVNELGQRNEWIMNPTDSKWSSVLNGLSYLYYLGASPASAIVNMIQVPQIVFPFLGARHGWSRAAIGLSKAMGQAIRTRGNMHQVLTGEDLKAYKALQETGIFQRTQTHMLAGLAAGNRLKSSPAWTNVMNWMSYMFQTAEVINREATGMAAFRLARGDGKSFMQAIQYAGDATNGTHGDYSNSNRSRHMQGNVAKVALQFKSYGVAMGYLWGRESYLAFKGGSAEERTLARKTVLGMMGMTGLFAGTLGLPMINALKYTMQAMHAGFGDDDTPWDFDTEFRNWLAEWFGDTAASMIADGVVNKLGANVSSRVGMSDLLFRDDDRPRTNSEAVQNMFASLMGPTGGVIVNLARGSDQIGQGHISRGIETMLPTFAKNAMKSVRYASEGVNTLKGAPIVDDVSGPAVFAQLIGFRPTSVAEQQRKNNVAYNTNQFVQDRRGSLMNAYAMALQHGDGDDRAAVMRKIGAFNRKWPQWPIGMSNLRASIRGRAQALAQAQHGVRINKRIATQIQQRANAQEE